MAKKTPDYTKQARKKRPESYQARQSASGSKQAQQTSSLYSKQARQGRLKERQQVEPVSRTMRYMCYSSLGGAMALFVFDLYTVLAGLAHGENPRSVGVVAIALVGGLVCNVAVLMLCMYTFDRRKHPFHGISKKGLLWAVVLSGMLCIMVVISSNYWQVMAGPGLLPPIGIFAFILRPRLKALAIADGRYKPSKSDKAREDYERERAERKAEKEAYEALKRARLGDDKTGKNAATAARKPGKRPTVGKGSAAR